MLDTLYSFMKTASDHAIALVDSLGELFQMIVVDHGTLGDFLSYVLPDGLSWVTPIVDTFAPFSITEVVLTGIGLYFGVAIVKWFVGVFT